MMKITGLSHLFKWENLHNWWLTKYFFAPLYIYRMDEIKSLLFHIMFYRLYRGVAKYIVSGNLIPFHHLSDCDLYTPPTTGREGETEAGGERPARY